MLYKLNTPVAATMNGKKIKDWCYRVEDISKLEGKEVKYFKGLGSWTKELLDQVIKEEFKKRQELKNLEKPQKKIKSKKYTPPIG